MLCVGLRVFEGRRTNSEERIEKSVQLGRRLVFNEERASVFWEDGNTFVDSHSSKKNERNRKEITERKRRTRKHSKEST